MKALQARRQQHHDRGWQLEEADGEAARKRHLAEGLPGDSPWTLMLVEAR
jgi:hypothetical protein